MEINIVMLHKIVQTLRMNVWCNQTYMRRNKILKLFSFVLRMTEYLCCVTLVQSSSFQNVFIWPAVLQEVNEACNATSMKS